MNTRQLLEKRSKIVAQLRDMQDTADATADGAMTPEQTAAFEALKAALSQLEETLTRRASIEEAERRSAGTPLGGGTGDNRLDYELRRFSITRAIAAAAGLNVDASREREISQELARRAGRPFNGIAVPVAALSRQREQRVITTESYGAPGSSLPGGWAGGAGGALIATNLDAEQYVDLLRANLRIRSLGARYITGLVGNVDLPRLAQAAAAGWVAENTPLPMSDEQFDKVPLRPKHAGAIVEFSRNMLMQSSPAIEELVRGDLAAVLARVLDSAAIAGTGLNNDPVGILNAPGVAIVPAGGNGTTLPNGSSLVFTAISDLIGAVQAANAMGDAMGFLTNTQVRQTASKALNGMGQPVGLETFFQGERLEFSNLVPNTLAKGTGANLSALIYGNWSDLAVGVWSELDILVNPYAETAYAKGNVQVRAMMTVDIALRHPQSFAAMVDINTTQGALLYAGELLNGGTGTI